MAHLSWTALLSPLSSLMRFCGLDADDAGRLPPRRSTVATIAFRTLHLGVAIAIATLSPVAIAEMPFDAAAWKADLAQLKKALEAQYANLAWKASERGNANLPALSREADAALDRAGSDARAANAIRAFIAGFHDGHLSELPALADGGTTVAEPSSPVLDARDPAAGCAALGFAPTGVTAFSLPFETLPGFKLLSDGSATTFRSGILRPRQGAALGLIRIHAFRARAYPHVCIGAWNDLVAAGQTINARSVREAVKGRWFDDLAASIRTLRAAGVEALVIDVGNNSGGDDSGDWTPRLLTARPVRSARLLMVDAPIAARYFDEELGLLSEARATAAAQDDLTKLNEATAYFTRQKSLIGQHACDLSWVWREQAPWSPDACNRLLDAGYADGFSAAPAFAPLADAEAAAATSWAEFVRPWAGTWTGPTYVVADRRSYSSAEMFAAVMQDNGIAKLVGTRTGGDGCGFMADGPPLVLDHSRMRFRVPNCMRLRADGSNEEAGVNADLPILPTTGESERARAQRAALVIADDLQAVGAH